MSSKITLGAASISDILKTLPGWENMQRGDQSKLEEATTGLRDAFVSAFNSRLTIGKYLAQIQDTAPHGMFVRILEGFHLKKSTAFKQINSYRNATTWLESHFLEAAAARNMNMLGESQEAPLGVYSGTFKRLPPPNTKDPKKINDWLDQIEERRRMDAARKRKRATAQEFEYDEDSLLKECFRFCENRISKLSNRGRVRRSFIEKLSGMLVGRLGISNALTIEPEAVPDGFIAQVGRPRVIEASDAA